MTPPKAVFIDSRGVPHQPDLSALSSLGPLLESQVITCYNKFCSTYNSDSNGKKLRQLLKAFGKFAESRPVDFSNPPHVYSTFFDFRKYWFTTNMYSLNVTSRNDLWYLFLQFLDFCMLDAILPRSALPPGNPKLFSRSISDERGARDAETIASLVHIDLSRTDEAYLDELHAQLRMARDVFMSCARLEIEDTIALLTEGNALLAMTSIESLREKITANLASGHQYKEQITTSLRKRTVNIFSPRHPDFLPNVLTYITHELHGVYDGTSRRGRRSANPLLRFIQDGISADKLSGYLGLLTSRRAISFFVFLLLKNPRFTVEGLLSAEVEGRHGIIELISTAGEDGDTVRMRVKKPRAHSTKSQLLDDESADVLRLLLRLTRPLRDHLKRTGSPDYNRLWIVVPSAGSRPRWMTRTAMIVHFGRDVKRLDDPTLSAYCHHMASSSFLSRHPRLRLYAHTANLRLLRVTQGLITWFESGGDIQKVANTLGNTARVSLRHYIPRSLQLIMNKRMIRRFQNLLISAATVGEPYMLEVTDFSSIDRLHAFLAQTLLIDSELCGTLAKSVTSLLNLADKATAPVTEACLDGNSIIRVSISERNLAILFLYQEHIEMHLDIPPNSLVADGETRTTPLFWASLSRTLHALLPKDHTHREYHTTYQHALMMRDKLRGHIVFPHIFN